MRVATCARWIYAKRQAVVQEMIKDGERRVETFYVYPVTARVYRLILGRHVN